MCALTVAPPSPSSSDSRNDFSWAFRSAKLRIERPPAVRTVPLSFRDLRVSAQDVTTVGQAFARCSPEELLGAVMRHEAGWRIPVDAIGSRAHHMLAGRIAGALEAMRSLEDAQTALSPSREGIIGPLFRFAPVEGAMGLEHRVGAAVLSPGDASAVGECLSKGLKRVCTWDELRTQRSETAASVPLERLSPDVLRGSIASLARMPWERVLALPLWLPTDLSDEERWAIVAKVFWTMTYRGFTQKDASQGMPSGVEPVEERSPVRGEPGLWPTDPVLAVLDHNCWVDTLEAWSALLEAISPGETRL